MSIQLIFNSDLAMIEFTNTTLAKIDALSTYASIILSRLHVGRTNDNNIRPTLIIRSRRGW